MKNQGISIILIMPFLLIIIFGFQTNLKAQTPPLWGDLKPGNYAVGFKTIEKYDYSRTFRPQYGYFGEPIEGDNHRPIQICLWYPAKKSADASNLVLGEYIFPYPENADFYAYVTVLQQRELQRITEILGGNRGMLLDASNIEMGAVRDAVPADGTFPLIVYCPDLMNGISDNMVLCEYLASHGFVVLTTHQVGTTRANLEVNQIDFETVIRDKEFALANIRDLDFINLNKIGSFGVGGGGLAALIMQMRNFDIEAVAGLAGWNINRDQLEFVEQNPHFTFNRMDKPLLQVYYEDDRLFDLSLIDSIKYSNRYMLKLASAPAGGFTCYPAIQSYMDTTNVTKTISRPNYDLTGLYILNFFQASLTGDETGRSFIENVSSDKASFEFIKGMDLPPTPDQFVRIIRSQGGKKAVELYRKFEESDPGSITFQEAIINFFGYQALQQGQNDDAIALFKLNADTFPNSANCWDSYSDGLQAIGDNAGALECYRKVLEVLPVDTTAGDQLRETLKANAETGIERLSNESN